MGLIKAGMGALGGTLADQWKEFFYCESMPKEVLVTKGQKRTTGRSSNTKGNDNIISNGSGIAVADGQCMIIVEQPVLRRHFVHHLIHHSVYATLEFYYPFEPALHTFHRNDPAIHHLQV